MRVPTASTGLSKRNVCTSGSAGANSAASAGTSSSVSNRPPLPSVSWEKYALSKLVETGAQ